jgi:hypothetical protein
MTGKRGGNVLIGAHLQRLTQDLVTVTQPHKQYLQALQECIFLLQGQIASDLTALRSCCVMHGYGDNARCRFSTCYCTLFGTTDVVLQDVGYPTVPSL